MSNPQPDTPGSSPDRHKEGGPRDRSAFNLNGHEDGEASPHSAHGYDRPDQTVFDLTMDYSDDDTLLDWEQYAGMRKFKCWGMDCSVVARFCPFLPWVPPEWYYRYSRRQRKLMKMGFAVFGGLLALLIGATVLLSLLPKQGSPQGLGFANEECAWSGYNLPGGIKPQQYDLEMSVQLQEPFLVTGKLHVHTSISKSTKCIVLHAVDMNISQAELTSKDPPPQGTWKFNDQEQLILQFPEALRPPAASFSLHFNYTLKQGLSGFYRSNYTGADGKSHIMGTTQMEANSARKAFPCFDEPSLKAKWNFSMTAVEDQVVLFNMPEASSRPDGPTLTRHTFQITPPMSSYLVAFIVGNLTSVSASVPFPGGTAAERSLKVWGTPERGKNLQTALEIATKVLPAYEQMFGVPYPLPKLDLVAIPDFSAGAMENWGLITYRETDLLFSNEDSSIANERRIAVVVAHEMAHLWFGDLVTMQNWGELWLNEGFATYFENIGATIARPSFAYFDTFYSDFATSAMATDALPKSTHPLATLEGIDTAEKVESMFDDISYDKGGSVLRMLRAYLNRDADPQPLLRRSLLQTQPAIPEDETFLEGLQSYLQKFSFNNTSSNDLWNELSAATGEDVTGWMKSWTFQPGFPRVQILLDGPLRRDVKVYQAPFEYNGARTCDDSPKGVKAGAAPWWVPVATVSKYRTKEPTWTAFGGCKMTEPIYQLQDDDDWIKLNAGQFGLYRVNYPISLWTRLADAAGAKTPVNTPPLISAVDLAGLLDDAWALAQAGETPIDHFLELTRSLALRRAAEYAPWSIASVYLIEIHRMLQLHKPDPSCAEKWTAFMLANVTNTFLSQNAELALNSTLPQNKDAHPDVQPRLLRPLLLGLSAEFQDPLLEQQALAIFMNASKNSPLEVDTRGVIYSIVASSGKQSNYDAIRDIYLQATDPSEKARALGALAYAKTPELVNATLEFSLSQDVRSQDTTSLIRRVALQGGASLQTAWSFVRRRYSDIAGKLGGEEEAATGMGKLLKGVASSLADEAALQEVDEIFKAHKELTEPRWQEGAKEDIRANMDWLHRNAGPVCEWLSRL